MKRFFLFAVGILAAQNIFAGDNGRFRHYTTDDGLAENSVFAVVQDQQGFMWFGTGDGLSRFDGYSFVSFRPDPQDSFSLPGNSIRCLLADKKGNIWVGTRSGLCRFDPRLSRFQRFPADPASRKGPGAGNIMALAEDAKGMIWIATVNKGISIYNYTTNDFSSLRHKDGDVHSLCGDDVRGLAVDARGHVWATTWAEGVCEYDPATGKFSSLAEQNARLSYPNIRGAVCAAKDGKIWIGTWGGGMDVWDPQEKKMQYYSVGANNDDPKGMIWSLMQDSKGRMWVATAETGLFMIDLSRNVKKNFVPNPNNPFSISDDNVWSLCEDKSGQIWAGTWQGGVNVLDGRLDRFSWLWADPNDVNSLPSKTIWSFCGDGANGLWIGTGAGPVHYNRTTGNFDRPPLADAQHPGPTDKSNIQSLCHQPNGKVWVGTNGGGLFSYDPVKKVYREYVPTKDTNSIGGNIINALYSDAQGNLWVGGGNTLQRYDSAANHFVNYHFAAKDSVSPNDGIYCIVPRDENHFWIGMISGKIFLFERTTKNFAIQWRSPGNEITAIYQDYHGGIWIGTGGNGLFYFKDGKTTAYTLKDGLPNNVINGIVTGAKDEIWLSTNHGICMLDPLTGETRSYDVQDGLQGNEFNENAFFRCSDGQIWFGGINGITAFYPKDILPNPAPAPVAITAFNVFNKKYPLQSDINFTDEITLSWKDCFFSFEFSGLEFTNPARNHYSYMMEGFDDDWMDAGTRRFASYTNLPPGEYTFRVKASNNDNVWSNSSRAVHIIITPPFWKTKWFYTLCGFTVLFSGWGGVRYRERKLRKEKEVLETKVSERTAELQEEKEKVTAAHKDIRDSINYAQRIQYALLAQDELLRKNLEDYFVLFRPKDVVSGDFYWATQRGDKFYLAVCDSTGHGVPGAFMSLLNTSFLNEAIIEKKMEQPGEVFNYVRSRLIENISQDGAQDGMDAILVCFDHAAKKMTYVAAHNAPVVVRGQEILQLETDKMPVGKGEKNDSFKTFSAELQKGDLLYLFTDGFADQFGGPSGKKFKEANLKKLLLEISSRPAQEQKAKLEEAFEKWKGSLEQVDDVLMIGVRI